MRDHISCLNQHSLPLFVFQIVKKQNYFLKAETVPKRCVKKISRGFIFADRRIRQILQRQILAGLPKKPRSP